MRSFFRESGEYLPPHARRVKLFHTGFGEATRRCLQMIASRGKIGMALVTTAIIIGFFVATSALAAGNNSHPPVTPIHATATIACTYVHCNPWGYNFSKGKKITHPPAAFCHYFTCIGNFARGKGYVEECRDGKYSKSGGRSGSCADHRGNWRALLGP